MRTFAISALLTVSTVSITAADKAPVKASKVKADAVEQLLNRRIPRLILQNVSIEDALEHFRDLSRSNDPQKKGLSFILRLDPSDTKHQPSKEIFPEEDDPFAAGFSADDKEDPFAGDDVDPFDDGSDKDAGTQGQSGPDPFGTDGFGEDPLDEALRETISMNLSNVSLRTALNLFSHQTGYGWKVAGKITFFKKFPLPKLKSEASYKKDDKRAAELLKISKNWSGVTHLSTLLFESRMPLKYLSPDGRGLDIVEGRHELLGIGRVCGQPISQEAPSLFEVTFRDGVGDGVFAGLARHFDR